jgi:ABC-2 type transport system permease protein
MADAPHEHAFRKVLAIAFREFRHTALTKGFIFGALVVPLMMFAAIAGIGALVGSQMAPVSGTLAVVDASGAVAEFAVGELAPAQVNRELEEAVERTSSALPPGMGKQAVAQAAAAAPRIDVHVEPVADPSQEAALRARVQGGSLLGLAIVPPDVLQADPKDAGFTLIVPSKSPPRLTKLLEKSVARAIVKARVRAAGSDYVSLNALLSVPDTSVRRLAFDGKEASESVVAKTMLPMGFMMLLWICTFTSGQYLLTSTIEEKSSKVMEVVLSAVSPMQLLVGKILGYAMVSAVMLGMYGGLAVAGLSAAAMADLVSPWMLLLMAVYFVMAYAFVSTMMASVGSAVNDLREAQSLVTPAMLVLMVPLILWLPISEQPNGVLATVMSFVPPAIPFVMILRVTASSEPIAAWQVAASIVWGFAWVGVFVWAGAKVFRVGVLMQGKPPTPKELLKWIRMA